MVETSFFWDGTTVGDAASAPYNDDEIATALGTVIGDFVIPYTYASSTTTRFPGEELQVFGSSAVVGKLNILGGAAFVKGVMYVLDDDTTIDIASNAAGNPRIDRVVLRRSTAGQTVRLVVIQGTPGATPTVPAITSATDMSLAWLWVANGYDAAISSIAHEEVHDERVFREIGPSHQLSARKNLIQNSEFFGVGGLLTLTAPDKWKAVLTPINFGFNNAVTARGWRINFDSVGGGEGLETTVSCNQVFISNPVFTLSGYLVCDQGVMHLNIYRVNLSTGASTIERIKKFRPLNGITNFIVRESIKTEQDAIRIEVVGGSGGTDEVKIGEFVLNEGYNTVVAYNHETIWFDAPLIDAAWTASAKSTGVTTINLTTFAGTLVLPYIRGVILRVRCRDSGSAGAADTFDTAITIHHNLDTPPSTTTAVGIVSCAGKANDSWEEQVMYVPIDITDANAPFKVYVYASGVGTLDATIEILGIIT